MRKLPPKSVRRAIAAKLDAEAQASAPDLFRDEDVLSPGQIVVVQDTAPTVVLEAGRRFGKSTVACKKAYNVARAIPGCTVVLVGATQGSIQRIFWRTLKDFNKSYKIGVPREGFRKGAEGWSVSLPNSSQILLLPVDSIEAADKARGLSKVALVIVDESQRYKKDVLDYLLLDVIKAMFIDIRAQGGNAQLWLIGTPNPLGQYGTFWEYRTKPGSSLHTYTTFDNTKLGTREQIEKVVDEMLAEEGVDRESAWYQREIMCRWVVEIASRAYYFDDWKNVWTNEHETTCATRLRPEPKPCDCRKLPILDTYAIVGDTGVRDADALGVYGWRQGDPTIYLVREEIRRGQDALDLAAVCQVLVDEYHPILIALDAGGGGTVKILTLQRLFQGLPISSVTKPPIPLQVRALNDRLARGFRCSRESRLYAEIRLPTWENGVVGGKLLEDGAAKSDIVPCARYAALELADYVSASATVAPADAVVSPALAQLLEQRERAQASKQYGNLSYDPYA